VELAIAVAFLALSLIVGAVLLLRRAAGPNPATLQAAETIARSLGSLQSELTRVARTQDDLRQAVQQGREQSLLQLAETSRALHGEIGQAQRALAEVRAIEQERNRRMDQAAESLRRLEAVVAGSATRGVAGENILARALAQESPLLLLDEPTAHLDIGHQADVLSLVLDLCRKGSHGALAVIHDLTLAAQFCRRLIIMEQGRIVADGTPEDLLTKECVDAIYRARTEVFKHPVTGRPIVVPAAPTDQDGGL